MHVLLKTRQWEISCLRFVHIEFQATSRKHWNLSRCTISPNKELKYPIQYSRDPAKLSNTLLFISSFLDVWVIDQVWGQDGWITAKFFFLFMDRDGVDQVHKLVKKEPAIKDLLYGFRGNFTYTCKISWLKQINNKLFGSYWWKQNGQ